MRAHKAPCLPLCGQSSIHRILSCVLSATSLHVRVCKLLQPLFSQRNVARAVLSSDRSRASAHVSGALPARTWRCIAARRFALSRTLRRACLRDFARSVVCHTSARRTSSLGSLCASTARVDACGSTAAASGLPAAAVRALPIGKHRELRRSRCDASSLRALALSPGKCLRP